MEAMKRVVVLATVLLVLLGLPVVAEDLRPLILVCNDDGIESESLRILALEMAALGEVVVVAPRHNASGVGHGITYRVPMAYGESDAMPGLRAYWVEALPATCVRWALDTQLDGRAPDLVISGINDGVNIGMGVYYSGTVGAAREGAFGGAVAVALSIDRGEEIDIAGAARFARRLASRLLEADNPPRLLNVNFPCSRIDEETEVRITRLTLQRWPARYHDRVSPRGGNYFWITFGSSPVPEEDSDAAAIADGVISITPLLVDPTDEAALEEAASIPLP